MTSMVFDDVVIRRHPTGTARDTLAAQLAVASAHPWREVLNAPLSATPVAAPDGALLTLWPRLEPLEETGTLPWWHAGAHLAALHRMPVPDALGEHLGREAVTAAVQRASLLKPGGATDVLRELGLALLDTWPQPTWRSVVHGDWNFSRIGRPPGHDVWLLDGLDRFGVGDPAWDLGGPAGLFAVGLIDEAAWQAFLNGYRSSGGPAPRPGAPWEALEHPARCAVFQAAVQEIARDEVHRSELAEVLLEACMKMIRPHG